MRKKNETWRLIIRGKVMTLSTKAASLRAMDDAMKIYERALGRMAKS